MTRKYERQCWNCNSRDIENKGDYVQCRKCGATWNVLPQLGGPLVEPGNVTIMTRGEVLLIRAKHPSAGVKRRAARARKTA